MKTANYGTGVRLAVTVLEICFVTMCVVCIGIVSCNAVISVPNRKNTLNINYYISPFSKTAAFEDSSVFNDMVYDNLNDVIRYCVIRSQLETDGVFDETKEIDIEQYARHFEEIPVTDTSVAYRLGDLIQWGQSGEGISLEEYSYADAERMIREAHGEELAEAAAEEGAEAVIWSDTDAESGTIVASESVYEEAEYVYEEAETDSTAIAAITDKSYQPEEERSVFIPVERYLPVDGQSVLAHVNSVEELETMVGYLKETVRMLGENYTSYKECQAYYDKEELNFRYCVLREENGTMELYSNVGEALQEKDKAEIYEYFAAMGRYLYFAPADFMYESNTSIREEQVRNIWNSYRYAYPDHTAVWAGIDTRLLSPDAFRIAEERYEKAAPGYLFILFSVLCGIVALILLGIMTGMSGRKKGTEGIALLWFDRWYTGISAAIGIMAVCILVVMTGVGVSELYSESDDPIRMLTVLALGTALTNGVFLFFYLSLVRRIKAKLFWRNFLIYHIFLKLKKIFMDIYDDSRNVVRVWVPYLLFVAVNLLLITTGSGAYAAVILDFLVGVFLYQNNKIRRKIVEGIENIRSGDLDYQIDMEKMHGDNRILAEAVNSIGNGIRQAVETSMKDERMKADLITNVSHDIKTPLTSIINYVDLIKREPVENEKIKDYLKILDNKSQRLKQLTEDLVEASKISSGNIVLQCDKLDFVELMNQAVGEFVERFEERGLKLIVSMEEKPLLIYADSRRMWRVMENLFQNACKYALENTRVYIETKKIPEENGPGRVRLSIKNISAQPLNIDAQDLTERFIRGDVARTTEGSGLGLSIAKSLTELQKGKFEIISDGDLFKVVITFSLMV